MMKFATPLENEIKLEGLPLFSASACHHHRRRSFDGNAAAQPTAWS
jgi:hypothetical protein